MLSGFSWSEKRQAGQVLALCGALWQPRKSERAQAFLLGLYDRLERTRSEYVRRDEFLDLFEETLRRTAEQPETERCETMGRMLSKILESPRGHVENRLLIRLADELPAEALKALAVVDAPLTKEEIALNSGISILAARIGTWPEDTLLLMTYLSNENLLDKQSFNVQPGFGAAEKDLKYLLTSLGLDFVEYAKG